MAAEPAGNLHLVARCPTCERPIWTKQIVKLLGMVPFARRFPDLGFVAQSRKRGRGWTVKAPLRSLADVVAVAGVEAVEQLRKLARQSFQRMWFQGLLTRDDVDAVLATTTLRRDPAASVPPLHISEYKPGSRVEAAAEHPKLAKTEAPPLTVSRWKP